MILWVINLYKNKMVKKMFSKETLELMKKDDKNKLANLEVIFVKLQALELEPGRKKLELSIEEYATLHAVIDMRIEELRKRLDTRY